ncbi:MAG: MMPL family transporter, partial [Bacteroidales bacterium]
MNRSTLYIIIPVIITLLMVIPLLKARINPDLNEYLPQHTPAKLNIERIDSLFGEREVLLLVIEAEDILAGTTLRRIKSLTEALDEADEIRDVISLFTTRHIRGEEGAMFVDPAVPLIPENDEEREWLASTIRDNPLAHKLFISEDFRHSLMIVNPAPGVSDEALFGFLQQLLKEHPGPEKVMFGGMPYLRYEVQRNATRDLAILMPLGLVVMILFLYFSFREIKGVFLPLSVVLMSTVLALGLMPVMGFELSLIAVLSPILMIAVANNYGVHIISRYQELNASGMGWSMPQITGYTLRKLRKPIIFTGLTTIAGILGLVVHIMLPARQMGIVCAIGIAWALILSLTFVPEVLSRLKPGKRIRDTHSQNNTPISRILGWCGNFTTRKPVMVIVVFAVVFLIATAGIFRLRVSISNEKMLPESHQIRQAVNIADKAFGGTKFVSVLFEGDIMDPKVMQAMDNLEQKLKRSPEIGSVTSIASVIRLMSKSLHDPGDPWYDTIPDSRAAIAQYIELYNMSGDPEDFEQMVDFDYSHALLNIQFRADNLRLFNKVIRHVEMLTDVSPHSTIVSGLCLVEKEMAVSIARGQIWSLIFALGAIAILLWIIFRSFRSGLMGSIPLFFTLACNFGLMGWLGVELDIATSLLSSIAIGLGVDYTIHLFW